MSDPRTRIAALLLAAVTALIGWWAWKQGAYFGPVFYPGAFFVFGLLGLLLAFVPFTARLQGPALLALSALAVLAAWMVLSALWSPAPGAAFKYGEHAFLYVALFAIGVWATHLLAGRMLLALAPIAVGVALVGVATVVVLATGTDVTWYLHQDATLRFPIGYRNANAAFFLIGLWSMLALATEAKWRWELRALLVGLGTMVVELAVLAQSRGSLPAFAVALAVFLVLSPHPLRLAAVFALVVLPVVPVFPILLDVYQHGHANPEVIPFLSDAAKAIGASVALSLLLATLAFRGAYPRLRLGADRVRALTRLGAVVAVLTVVAAGSIFVARHGGPVGFVDQRVKEFRRVNYPDLRQQGVRYGANIGSERGDFWRVALDQGSSHPLLGGGAGSFKSNYLIHRRGDESPEDPHSVEALMFSELGLPGLLLLVLFLGGAALAALRSRRLGPAAAALTAGSLAVGAQWLVQASYDWIWNYPGITAAAVFLLGAAAAPALLDPLAGYGTRIRALGIGALVLLTLVGAPLFLSDRYLRHASEEATVDPRASVSDLERAAELNPFDAEPLLSKGVIELKLGETSQALEAFHEAARREPDNYAAYYYLGSAEAESDPIAARSAVREARDLNPRDPGIAALERRLDKSPAQG